MRPLAAHIPALARVYGIDCHIDRNAIALTFDDGPHPQGTPATLEVLRQRGATATFFLVGEQVEAHPDIARAIVAAGHELGVHGYRHTLLLRRRASALASDFDRAFAAIASVTGVEPTLYRPPYGVFSRSGLALARARGWRPLLWSRWGRDWERRATAASIARRASRDLSPGDVVLLHDSDAYSSADSWRSTVAALPSLLDAIAALGVEASAVTQST